MLMAYTKTNWNESTPITADKLNKIENGIASALPLTGGTLTGSITLPNSTKGQIKHTLTDGTATETVYITTNNNLRLGSADIEKTYLYSKANPAAVVDGKTYNLYHTGNKPSASDVGALPLTGGEITGTVNFNSSPKLPNDKYILGTDTSGTSKSVLGITMNDNCVVGSPDLALRLRANSATGVSVYYNSKAYPIYHTGNKPTATDVGALPLTGGALTGNIEVHGESRFYNDAYTDPWYGVGCAIKASGNVGIGGSLKVNQRLTALGNIESPIVVATEDLVVDRHGFRTFYTNNQYGSFIHCHKNNSSINLIDGKMTYANPNGNLEIGPYNSFHCHFSTDRPTFHFNKDLLVNGNKVYHTGNKPTAWDIGAMSSNSPSFQGNMIQSGEGGRDWIYHINADMGSLHIAPHNNGNNDWDNQIQFDRNGVIFCNGRKKVPTMADGSAAHYMFRYGSGLGGANGYITFSY